LTGGERGPGAIAIDKKQVGGVSIVEVLGIWPEIVT